jgi:hypothetical protein
MPGSDNRIVDNMLVIGALAARFDAAESLAVAGLTVSGRHRPVSPAGPRLTTWRRVRQGMSRGAVSL